MWHNGGVPSGSIKGNGATTVGYTANGEASDYFLGHKGIYSLSPELGTASTDTYTFFITKEPALIEVVQTNYHWILFTIKHLFSQIEIKPFGVG